MSDHVVSPRVYVAVFAALLALTMVTVLVANVDLGGLNALAAMTIACVKGLLVVLYFMHARYGSRLIWVLLAGGVLWLIILIALTMADYATRGWLPLPSQRIL